tara:strand:+ start:1 stop:849 length:849 start_codon:yes stop_codon:yes gene_type:complete
MDFSKFIEYDNLLFKINNNGSNMIKIPQSQIKKYRKQVNRIKYSDGFQENYNIYLANKKIFDRKRYIEQQLSQSHNYIENDITKVIKILHQQEYISNITNIDKNSINIKGIIASEINECNEILLTELIFSGKLDNIEYRDLGAIISIFSDSKPSNTDSQKTDMYCPDKYIDYISFIDSLCKKWSDKEALTNLFTNSEWIYNTYLLDCTYRWLNNESFELLAKEFDLYEGNLIKDFIKIYNISAEIEKIAEIIGKQHLGVEAAKVRENIVRDIVNIESLYIKK